MPARTNFIVHLLLCTLLLACTEKEDLRPFSSDGCSLFPDSSLITHKDWCDCCFQHDLAYWRGGTQQQRENADLVLKQCVLDKSGDPILADVMFNGVRFGGSPYFYNWYRWGYGWSYTRKYEALTQQENALADKLMQEYLAKNDQNYCRMSN